MSKHQVQNPRGNASLSWGVLDALTDHICLLDASGIILMVNRAWRGFAAANLPFPQNADVGANYFAVCEAAVRDDASLAREALQGLQAVSRGESPEFTLEYPCHSPDIQRWFELRATRLEDGDSASLLVTHRDITKRRQSEDLLRTQRDLFLALSRMHDLPEMLRNCLDAALQLSGMECGGIYLTDVADGLRLAAFSGLSAGFLEAAAYYPADAPNTRLVMAGRAVYARYTELKVRLAEAERLEALRALAVVPIFHEKRIIGCLNVASRKLDEVPPHSRVSLETIASTIGLVISRAQVEAALRESEERFRTIADYTADLECWFGPDGRLIWINPAVEPITGYTVAECLAMPGFPSPLFRVDELARNNASFQEALRGSHGSDWEFRFVRKDGAERWGSVAWQPIYSGDGRHLGHRSSVRDITDRKRLVAERTAALARLAVVEEQERRRISRELHDQTAQRLVALAIELKALETNLAAGRAQTEQVRSLRKAVDDLQQQVRVIAWDLRGSELVEGDLETALRDYVEDWSERSQVLVDCECRGLGCRRLPAQVEAALYRATQEALANVEKHAQARRVSVLLERDAVLARLTVEDDGRGFDVDAIQPSSKTEQRLGLLGMRERVALAGGTLLIESSPGSGTTILVRIPIPIEAKPS